MCNARKSLRESSGEGPRNKMREEEEKEEESMYDPFRKKNKEQAHYLVPVPYEVTI